MLHFRPKAFLYTPRGTRRRFGFRVHTDRTGMTVSAGVRDVKAFCLWIPFETESHWIRRHEARLKATSARLL